MEIQTIRFDLLEDQISKEYYNWKKTFYNKNIELFEEITKKRFDFEKETLSETAEESEIIEQNMKDYKMFFEDMKEILFSNNFSGESSKFNNTKCCICYDKMVWAMGCDVCSESVCISCLAKMTDQVDVKEIDFIYKCPCCRNTHYKDYLTGSLNKIFDNHIYCDQYIMDEMILDNPLNKIWLFVARQLNERFSTKTYTESLKNIRKRFLCVLLNLKGVIVSLDELEALDFDIFDD